MAYGTNQSLKVIWIEHGKVVKIGASKKICDEYFEAQMGKDDQKSIKIGYKYI